MHLLIVGLTRAALGVADMAVARGHRVVVVISAADAVVYGSPTAYAEDLALATLVAEVIDLSDAGDGLQKLAASVNGTASARAGRNSCPQWGDFSHLASTLKAAAALQLVPAFARAVWLRRLVGHRSLFISLAGGQAIFAPDPSGVAASLATAPANVANSAPRAGRWPFDGVGSATSGQRRLLIALNLKQDYLLIKTLLPLLPRDRVAVVISPWLAAKLPAAMCHIKALGLSCTIVGDAHGQRAQYLQACGGRVGKLLAVTETRQPDHQWSRNWVEDANRYGIETITMQHGFENIGLTYFDRRSPPRADEFASRVVLTWCSLSALAPEAPMETRNKCRPIGYPKAPPQENPEIARRLRSGRTLVGVFENLHWHRYTERYREEFARCLIQTAASCPALMFVVKTHPAGQWLRGADAAVAAMAEAGNIVLLDPQDPFWSGVSAEELLPHLSAVISTPSTVVLDAAMHRVPVAVVAGDLALPIYAPLPMLRQQEDWHLFMGGLQDAALSRSYRQCRDAFAERSVCGEDGLLRLKQFCTVG